MAMTFSSQGCRTAANDLNSSAKNLDNILNNLPSAVLPA